MAQRRLYFDERRINPDLLDVLEAAALLQVTEFELFKVAFRWWYGQELEEAQTERYYVPYMFKESIPIWVRQFARHVMAEADAERLDPRRYGISPRPVSMTMFQRGLRYLLWLTIVMASFLTMIIAYQELSPWAGSCYLPPCY